MNTYKFKYRKNLFWKTETVIGHGLNLEANRMDLYFEDGSILSIGKWSEHDVRLGTDWVLFTKNNMEKEAGRDIKLSVNP